MGLMYLWDTNTVIYYLQKNFTDSAGKLMNDIINKHQPIISAITEIELLCWRTDNEKDLNIVREFIADSVIIELHGQVKIQTVTIRKNTNVKLPDAIIAATALANRLTLISRNRIDFKKIPSLTFIDPFEMV